MENQNIQTNYSQTDGEVEIDLVEIFFVLLGRLPMMLAAGLLSALAFFLVSKFLIPPTYESTTKIYILNKQDNTNVTYTDLQMGTQLTKDYAELIQSRFVLEEVIEQLGLEMDYEEMKGAVSVTTPTDTRIIAITVRDRDPAQAMQIANAVREAASAHIRNVMDIEAVNVVETADMPTEKASPRVGMLTLIGGLLGMFLVAVAAIAAFLMDDTVKTSEDVERYLELSTLALIPLKEGEAKSRKVARKR